MLTYVLSYHQVSPLYLEHILTFGEQEHPTDFHFISFSQDNTIKNNGLSLKIPRLGRSGRELRLFYTLKFLAAKKSPWPWSIRPVAVYHAFDFESGQSTWIITKGQDTIREKISDMTDETAKNGMATLGARFGATLQTHLALSRSTSETWSGYITYLEQCLQNLTSRALLADVSNEGIQPYESSPIKKSWTGATTLRSRLSFGLKESKTTSTFGEKNSPSKNKTFGRSSLFTNRRSESFKPGFTYDSRASTTLSGNRKSRMETARDQFSFRDLQTTQRLEEKVQEALIVLSLDAKVLAELRRYYNGLLASPFCPDALEIDVVSNFDEEISNIESVLAMLISRFEALLRLIQNRKSLVRPLVALCPV
jgi:hypothetical protein